jgi:hypothetical protein
MEYHHDNYFASNYVVVSKLISKFDITHDSRDENINILISVIYDLDNGITIEHYINNQEEAEKNALRKIDFQGSLKIALIIYHLKKPAQLKIIPNPNKNLNSGWI